MAMDYSGRSAEDLASLYETDSSIHNDMDFWVAFLESDPGPVGKVLANYFVTQFYRENPEQDVSDVTYFSVQIDHELIPDPNVLADDLAAAFPQLEWEPGSISPTLYQVSTSQNGNLTTLCLCSPTITQGSEIANSLTQWFQDQQQQP